ncbi:MAG: aspartate-semialdehyde dehydrogenase [Proteobacteria bacterium]|nr:aspartate-semialdehyde dehydrogenase [Pseudomonadota bacterium]
MNRTDAGYRVAVVGATGAVGREMVNILESRDFPVSELTLLASERSAGETVAFRGKTSIVQALGADVPEVDIALFSAGGGLSKERAPDFAAMGAVVIDNSSAWRMDPAVPLVVPEVNAQAAFAALKPGAKRIIANPNCSTIQLVVALKPLADAFGLRKVVVSTYQSVSGAGQKGISELSGQVTALFNNLDVNVSAMPHQIAFNCIPSIGSFLENGYTDEEWKLVAESRKIMGMPKLHVSPTAVRVPVFSCHSEAVHVICERKVTTKSAKAALHQGEGITLMDRPEEQTYPMGFALAGSDDVYIGRIRQDPMDEHALNLWVVADNLRKGAALNAVQIAEALDDGPEDDDE